MVQNTILISWRSAPSLSFLLKRVGNWLLLFQLPIASNSSSFSAQCGWWRAKWMRVRWRSSTITRRPTKCLPLVSLLDYHTGNVVILCIKLSSNAISSAFSPRVTVRSYPGFGSWWVGGWAVPAGAPWGLLQSMWWITDTSLCCIPTFTGVVEIPYLIWFVSPFLFQKYCWKSSFSQR
jgi:hypothetical protein